MLVDVPVTITFDHKEPTRHGGRAYSTVFTMRYDTDPNIDTPAQWVNHYPPRPNAHWSTDEKGLLFALLTGDADRSIKRMADEDPETYSAKVA